MMPLHKLRTLAIYMLLGIAVAFLVGTLLNWIFADMVRPIPMAIFIGVLLAFIFWALHYHSKRSSG